MSVVWGVHMPESLGFDAVEQGYVAIGWPELGDLRQIGASREAVKAAVAEAYPDLKEGSIPVTAGVLFRFVHEIEAGDVVIYPSKHDRQVNIGRFTGEIEHVPSDEMPNRRRVEWLGHFPRSDFSQSALYEIGSFLTLFSVRTHAAEFLAKVALASPGQVEAEEDASADDDSVTGTVSRQAVETTQDFVVRKLHKGLSGFEFEHFTAHLLECMGYTARVSEKTGDGGVDVIAHTDELGFEPPIIKVQCKRRTDQIGEPEVSQLLGTLGEGECALFVTLGSYSRAARALERNRPKLRLIDGEQLVRLFMENYAKFSARYRTLIPLRQAYIPDVVAEE